MRHASYNELFGAVIGSGGVTSIPAALFKYQGQLGLSFAEIGLIGAVLSFRHTAESPFPSLRTLMKRSGMSLGGIHYALGGLARRGFVTIEERYHPDGDRTSNGYDFSPLFSRLVALMRADGEQGVSGPDRTPRPVQTGHPVRFRPDSNRLI